MDIETLKCKLCDYLNKDLSKDHLIEWGQILLDEMLSTKEIFHLDCLFVYPFLSRISINKNNWEAINEKTAKEYLSIMNGEMDFSYCFITKLEQRTANCEAKDIIKILNNYITRTILTDDEYNFLFAFTEKTKKNKVNTLSELILNNVTDYIECLPQKMGKELAISSLFIQDEINNSVQYVNFIINWIEAYLGIINIYVNISFVNGNNMLSLNLP